MAPSAGEAVGAVLNGRYKLARLIGEGGLAAVYEAVESRPPYRPRAIKLLHPQYVGNANVVGRFRAEAAACASLRHPHIAVMEGYHEAEDGSPYLVMELLEGINLEDYLRRYPPMPLAVAAPIAMGILQALAVAHAQGIVHRDLKPANLFLVPEGSGYVVKVLDFGIAKVMDAAGGMGTKTRTGAVLGTPGYMSAEQVRDAKAVDHRTDLWSVGVVFYEMLCGKHPFGQAENLARMVAVLKEPATPIRHHAPQHAAWEPFFERALARDPNQRYQDAREMADDLKRNAGDVIGDGSKQTVSMNVIPDQRPSQRPASATAVSEAVPAASVQPSVGLPLTHEAAPHTQTGTQTMGAMPDVRPGAGAVTPAPLAGAPRVKPSGTQVSEAVPENAAPIVRSVPPPPIYVEEAKDEEPASLVWWAVLLVAVACFALGIGLGYVLAS